MKVLMVCSSGGHLDQLMVLLPPPPGVEVVFATFDKPDAIGKLAGYKFHALKWPTNRSATKALQNGLLALRIIHAERPDLVVSSGAAVAVPFFYVAKVISRAKTVFIECIDRIELTTLSAKLVRPVSDQFVCQWDTQLVKFPRRVQFGRSR